MNETWQSSFEGTMFCYFERWSLEIPCCSDDELLLERMEY